MGLPLGLLATLSLLYQHGDLVERIANAGPHHAPQLDADEQVPKITGSLHTVSGRLPVFAGVNYFWLSARPDQG